MNLEPNGEFSEEQLRALGRALLNRVSYAELLRSSKTLIGRKIYHRSSLTSRFKDELFMQKFKEAVGPEDFEVIETIIEEKRAEYKGEPPLEARHERGVPNIRIFERPAKMQS